MEPEFEPKEGQIDFSKARWCPVLNSVVVRGDGKILVVKRSEGLRLYPGYWNGISGFLDDHRSIEEKAKEELREELGINESAILSITIGRPFDADDSGIGKTWIVHPVLIKIKDQPVTLDWEASEYGWFTPQEISVLKTVPSFDKVLAEFNYYSI